MMLWLLTSELLREQRHQRPGGPRRDFVCIIGVMIEKERIGGP